MRYSCVLLRYLFVFCLSCSAPALRADVGTFLHETTDCTTGINWDGVVWDHVNASVAPGSAAGLYSVRLQYYNGGGFVGYTSNIDVHINADGSYTVSPEFDWPALSGAYGYYFNQWVVNGYITPMTVDGDSMYHAGEICDGNNGNTLHGTVNIVIGNQPGPYTKKCDRQDGGDGGCKECKGMARYSAHSMLASLNIEDTPISYTPPRGAAINFALTYNQRDNQQPSAFTYSNVGKKWTFNWLSYVTDDPNNASANANVYVSGGGGENYSGFDSGSQSYLPDPQSHAILKRILTSPIQYERQLPDGSKQVFTKSDNSSSFPRRIFMTQWVDAAGNAVALAYDSSFRITTITDSLGQATNFYYDRASDTRKITRITDPFGRTAHLDYDGNNQLATITDPVGIQSGFTYSTDGTNFINSMQTPYGTSTFATGHSGTNRWVEMTDPLGGKERVEYRDNAPGISVTESAAPTGMTNSGLDVANTFYFDKKYTALYPSSYDYTKARVIHWTKDANGSPTGIIASEKAALENRVWYSYAGQSDTNHVGLMASPSQVARILDDGTTQLWQYQYNSIGKMTQSIDPILRKMNYDYAANNIDLLMVRQTTGGANELLRTLTYNSLHEPLTDKDAAGQTTTYTYRADGHGQIDHVLNAKNERTDYAYGDGTSGHPTDYLVSVTGPTFNSTRPVTSYTYDSANRVRTVTTSPDNYTVTTDYDALDRPTTVTYPDATTQQFDYRKYVNGALVTPDVMTLDVGASKDRRGRTTYREFDGNRHLTKITEPYGNNSTRTTTYNWCTCGSLDNIVDPRGKVTKFDRDLQSRLTTKTLAYGTSSANARAYGYESTTSRLKSMADAKNQLTNYQYFGDNDLKQVSYTKLKGQPLNPPTPTVNFTYDPNYNRVVTMADGTGTTSYGYYAVTTPPALGATQLQTVDGPLANDTITYTYDELSRAVSQSINGVASSVAYDSLGRLSTSDDPLGHFTSAYDNDVTPRLKTLTFPTGQTSNYAYFDNSHDRRLQTLQDKTSASANISKFDYSYDPEGQIYPTWVKQLSTSPTTTSNLSYDSGDQLTQVVNTTPNNPSTTFSYGYDSASNRTSDNAGTYGINDLNQITNTGYSYDANGNLTADGVKTYQWDAANRLTTIIYPASSGQTEFVYDGLGRCVQITEKNATGIVYDLRKFVWSGMTIVEQRDSSNTVKKRFLAEGVQLPTGTTPNTKLYYSKDHLGSIRSLTNENGTITGTLDYDAYGGISQAPVPANDTSGAGPVLTSAVSRLTHSFAGPFDVNLPLTGVPGVEMRRGGANGNYAVVLTFDRNVLSDTSTTLAAGVGSVTSTTFSGNTATVQLSGIADRQTITIELDNVVGAVGVNTKVLVSMSACIGDVNQNGAVTVEDINLVKSQSGNAVTSSTFKYDVNVDGFIDAIDTSLDVSVAGGSLYPDFAFTGHYYHARSGLYLAPYRAYNPTIGRWLSRDPLENAELSQGTNLYSYVRNDVTVLFDPLGLSTRTFIKDNGITDWSSTWPHLWGHLENMITGGGFGANGNRAAEIIFHNVCTDPVFKHLVSVHSSNGWGAYIDPPNDAHIDVPTHVAVPATLINNPFAAVIDPARSVKLIAECSDDCG